MQAQASARRRRRADVRAGVQACGQVPVFAFATLVRARCSDCNADFVTYSEAAGERWGLQRRCGHAVWTAAPFRTFEQNVNYCFIKKEASEA